jgi:hypothetical protein
MCLWAVDPDSGKSLRCLTPDSCLLFLAQLLKHEIQ